MNNSYTTIYEKIFYKPDKLYSFYENNQKLPNGKELINLYSLDEENEFVLDFITSIQEYIGIMYKNEKDKIKEYIKLILSFYKSKGTDLNKKVLYPEWFINKYPNKTISWFSEGSKDLEKLLHIMHSNGIYTIACCKGHKERKEKAYILLMLNNDNFMKIFNAISSLIDSKQFKGRIIVDYNTHNNSYGLNITNDLEDEEFYKKLNQSFLECNKELKNRKLTLYMKKLLLDYKNQNVRVILNIIIKNEHTSYLYYRGKRTIKFKFNSLTYDIKRKLFGFNTIYNKK